MMRKAKESSVNIGDIEKELTEKLKQLSSLPIDLKKEKNSDIKEMIKYYNALTDRIEDRRIRIHSFGLQLLAISLTGIALLISQSTAIKATYLGRILFMPIILVVGVLIMTSLISSLLYEMQSWYRYPFLKLKKYGNKWKWFYYGNEEILKISTNPIFKSNKSDEMIKPYMNGLSFFVSNYKKENLEKEIADNIQQLYLLQVHNYYKNRFYLQLTKIWKWSFISVIIVISLGVIYYLLFCNI